MQRVKIMISHARTGQLASERRKKEAKSRKTMTQACMGEKRHCRRARENWAEGSKKLQHQWTRGQWRQWNVKELTIIPNLQTKINVLMHEMRWEIRTACKNCWHNNWNLHAWTSCHDHKIVRIKPIRFHPPRPVTRSTDVEPLSTARLIIFPGSRPDSIC